MNKLDIVESYINGNISWVKNQLQQGHIDVYDFVEIFIDEFDAPPNEILLFIKRIGI